MFAKRVTRQVGLNSRETRSREGRTRWAHVAALLALVTVPVLAAVGCGAESEPHAGEEIAQATSPIGADCINTPSPVSPFIGGVSPAYVSPATYSDPGCLKARVLDIHDYESDYAVGGHISVRWADELPRNAADCKGLTLRADLFYKEGGKWQPAIIKRAHGDYLRDDEPGDIVLPPKQPISSSGGSSGPHEVPAPGDLGIGIGGLVEICRGPAVYFHGAPLRAGQDYRLSITARTAAGTVRKFKVQSVAGTCGQNGDSCCTAGDVCATDLTCQSGLCKPPPCGASNQQCCGGNSCDNSDLTCQSGLCKPCGGSNQQCCSSGRACDNSVLTCESGLCKPCGGSNQQCCAGYSCDGSALTCQSGLCKPCGGSNQQCCAGNTCNTASLKCDGGTCKAAPAAPKCGGFQQPCCTSGAACQTSLECRPATVSNTPTCFTSSTDGCDQVGERCCEPTGLGGFPSCGNNLTCDPESSHCIAP